MAAPSDREQTGSQEWERFIDEDTKTPYYYNARTGESSWDVPEGYVERVAVETPGDDSSSRKVTPRWKRFTDKTTGKLYYYDEANDVTQWDEPSGCIEDGSDSESEDDNDEGQNGEESDTDDTKDLMHPETSTEAGSDHEKEKKPTENWVKHVDRSSGKPYFHDTVSGKTQWEEPEHYTEAAPSAPVSTEYQEYLNRTRAEKLAQTTQRVLDPTGNLSRLNALLSKIDDKSASAVAELEAEAAESIQERSKAEWQQHVDPHTHRYYYHNIVTGVTQWQKPDAPIASALADWIPPETTENAPSQKPPPTVSGEHYAAQAKFNRVTGKFEKLGGDDYWHAMGVASDREGRQMSHFFDVSQLEKNRQEAQRIKEELKRKNIDWKKVAAEKKAKKQKRKNEWIYND